MLEERTLAHRQAVEILAGYREQVWAAVQSSLLGPQYPPAFAVPATYEREHALHWSMVSEYPTRQGKYLRPTLLLLACEAMAGDAALARNTAVAMQLSEEWLLIHDDLEDGSFERRGGPTLHRMVGPALANNAGDALHAIMWMALFKNEAILGIEKTQAIFDEFFSMMSRTIEGQSAELQWVASNNSPVSDGDCLFLYDAKTGYYTVAGPMRLGALVAGATPEQLDALAAFGVKLGRCFQLVDDILDVTQDFQGLKKQRGNDIQKLLTKSVNASMLET